MVEPMTWSTSWVRALLWKDLISFGDFEIVCFRPSARICKAEPQVCLGVCARHLSASSKALKRDWIRFQVRDKLNPSLFGVARAIRTPKTQKNLVKKKKKKKKEAVRPITTTRFRAYRFQRLEWSMHNSSPLPTFFHLVIFVILGIFAQTWQFRTI